jgi:hypothetical protein
MPWRSYKGPSRQGPGASNPLEDQVKRSKQKVRTTHPKEPDRTAFIRTLVLL